MLPGLSPFQTRKGSGIQMMSATVLEHLEFYDTRTETQIIVMGSNDIGPR